MKTFSIDNTSKRLATIIGFFVITWLYFELEKYSILVCIFLAVVFISLFWYKTIVKIVQVDESMLELYESTLFWTKIYKIGFNEINFSYKIGLGGRQGIMKLHIFHNNCYWEISTSKGWGDDEIKAIVRFLRNSSAEEIE